MLMLEPDGTLVRPEQTATNRHEASFHAAIDEYVASHVDQHLRDVDALLDDLHQQIAPLRFPSLESLARRG